MHYRLKPDLFLLFCTISIFLSSCAANYQRFGKTSCESLSPSKECLRKIAIETGSKEQDIVLTDNYLKYCSKQKIIFSDIKKVIVTTGRKSFSKGRKYRLIVVTKNSLKRYHLITFDYFLAIDTYSTLECAAGISSDKPGSHKDMHFASPNTNTTKQKPLSQSEKYDLIAKLKELLDSGAITQSEYDAEKKKILEGE